MNLKIPLEKVLVSKTQKWAIPLMFLVLYVLDQVTKLWAEARFLNADGTPNYENVQVIGDYFRYSLAYNYGSAFSMKPQALVPFLSPTMFYVLISLVAVYGLLMFVVELPLKDWFSRVGVAMILSGALGNLSDRFRIGKVVDFIDCEFPDINIFNYHLTRWPTFNLADSWVLIGISMVLLAPVFFKSIHEENNQQKETKSK